MKTNISHKQITYFYGSSLLRSFGQGLVGSFGVIFFFKEFNNSFLSVIYLYIILYTGFLLLTPFGAKLFQKIGMEPLMRIALPFLALAQIALFFWKVHPGIALFSYIISVTIFKTLYWPPYHIDMAKNTDSSSRGKQLAILKNLSSIISMINPIISSFIIVHYGFSYLFIISTIIILLAILPLLKLKTTREKYVWGYRETFKKVISKENRYLFISHFGNGIQSIIGMVIWPIFIFTLFDEKYTSFGFIMSLSVISILLFRYLVGYISDRYKRIKLLEYTNVIQATGWLAKIFINTPFEVFMADLYHNTGKASQDLAYSRTFYEHAETNGHFVDEYTVLRETSINLGRVCMLLISIPVVIFFSPKITFVIAAIGTLLTTFENKEKLIN